MTEVEQVRLQVKRGILNLLSVMSYYWRNPFSCFLDVPKFSQIFWIKKPEVLIVHILQGSTSGTDNWLKTLMLQCDNIFIEHFYQEVLT